MTTQQSINIAYTIMWRTGLFVQALEKWNDKPTADKTWVNFKTHFRSAVKNYKKLKGPELGDSIYQNQMNMMNEFKNQIKTTISDEINKFKNENSSPPPAYYNDMFDQSSFQNDEMSQTVQHMANAITNFNQVIPKLVAQVDNLQQLVT